MSDEMDNTFGQFDAFFDTFETMFEKALERHNTHVKKLLDKELFQLKEELKEYNDLNELVEPVIDERIVKIRAELSNTSGEAIVKAIKQQIKESQPEMIDALYPIIGKLIRKYIKVELEALSENINKQIDNSFSFNSVKREFLSLFGIKEKDMILAKATSQKIEEVYLIEQASGILLGTYSQSEITDHDLIAGMLTAIKSFVKDAFQTDKDLGDLDTIEYGSYKIILSNFQRYYLVAVVSGVIDNSFKQRVTSYMELFGSEHLASVQNETLQSQDFSTKLKEHWQAFPSWNTVTQTANQLAKHVKQKSNFDWKFWRW